MVNLPGDRSERSARAISAQNVAWALLTTIRAASASDRFIRGSVINALGGKPPEAQRRMCLSSSEAQLMLLFMASIEALPAPIRLGCLVIWP